MSTGKLKFLMSSLRRGERMSKKRKWEGYDQP